MKASVIHAYRHPPEIDQVPDPVPAPAGAVVEVRANGICRSDWHAWMGHDATVRLPHVPGHEFAGVVAAVGPEVRSFRPGDRVTAPFCCGCGACEPCRDGHQNLCRHAFQPGFDGWGAFAQYVAVPNADVNLVRLPDELDFVAAASLGCRFATAFHGLVEGVAVRPGEWLAVFGCGGVGLSAVMIGAAAGASVIAVDIDPTRLELARELGAVAAIDASGGGTVGEIRELTRGGAHVAVDALGSARTAADAIRSLRERGRHLQLGLLLADDAEPRLPMHEVIHRELSIVGSLGMPAHRYPAMLETIRSGKLDPARLVSRRVSLEEAGGELAAMSGFAGRGVTVIDRF